MARLIGRRILAGGCSVLAVAIAGPAGAAGPGTVKIEDVGVAPAGVLHLEAGLAYEDDRELVRGVDYDNTRVGPLHGRYGLDPAGALRGLDVGLRVAYSSNSGDVDESGLESVAVTGKAGLTDYLALSGGLAAGGSDDVFPYGNDGLDLFLNLPFEVPLNRGAVYGELGYTAKGGDFKSYANYGIGVRLPVQPGIGMSVELRGHERTVRRGRDHMELLLGAHVGRQTWVTPWVGFGLEDGSPDVAIGLRFGGQVR